MAIKKRSIIKIDESKCNGCGECVPSCKEGALQIVDGKARLVKDSFCDGLGACLGECPFGALTIEERPAEEFDETLAVEHVTKEKSPCHGNLPCGCPGTLAKSIDRPVSNLIQSSKRESELRQWPIQLFLIPVNAPYLKNADLILLADCTAVAYANLHEDFIRGRVVAMACPKLDDGEIYKGKLADMIQKNNFRSIEVVMMEVPCCAGLGKILDDAITASGAAVNVKKTVVGLDGRVINNN